MGPANGHDQLGIAPQRLDRPLDHLTLRQHLTLSVLWFSLNFQSAALLPIVLPIQILLFFASTTVGNAQQATFLGGLSAAGAVFSLFVPALAGTLSDRSTSRWGRRRPFIAAGVALLVIGAALLAAPPTVLILLAGLLVFQLGGNICTGGYQGLLPDLVPLSERGAASGYIGLMTILGNALSLGLAAFVLRDVKSGADAPLIYAGTLQYFALTGSVLLIGTLITLIGVHEIPLPRRDRTQRDLDRPPLRARLAADWLAPWRERNFRWVFLTRAFVMLGLSLFMTFIAYYLANVAHVTNFALETAGLAILALVGAASSALTIGILSDRIGRVALVCFATGCMALAALAFVVFPSGTSLEPLGLLFGVGYGAYSSVDWALAVDVLPAAGATPGKDMGIWSIASTLPAILAPLVGGAALALAGAAGQTALGYRAVFALAVFAMVAGALCILFVRDIVTAPRANRTNTSDHPSSLGQSTGTTSAAPAGTRPPHDRRPSRRRRLAPGWRLASGTRAGHARGFLRFWTFWEWLNNLVKHPVPIPGAPYDLLHVEFITYKWRPIALPDGTEIRRGDKVAEIHINNTLVAGLPADTPTWRLMAMLAADMRALAAWSASAEFPPKVRALYGFTLLNQGAARLGFTLRERPHTIRTRLDRFYMMGTLALFNPAGIQRLRRGTTYGDYPVEVWMSRDELLRRYLPTDHPAPGA